MDKREPVNLSCYIASEAADRVATKVKILNSRDYLEWFGSLETAITLSFFPSLLQH